MIIVFGVLSILFCYRNETKLVSVDFLERVNNTTMGQILTTILTHFNISFNLPCLFLLDSAAYMKKCYREVLLPLMSQLIHVPCCAHIINLIGYVFQINISADKNNMGFWIEFLVYLFFKISLLKNNSFCNKQCIIIFF